MSPTKSASWQCILPYEKLQFSSLWLQLTWLDFAAITATLQITPAFAMEKGLVPAEKKQ